MANSIEKTIDKSAVVTTAAINIGPRHTVASFDVDAQNCFTPVCPDELPVPAGNEIVTELNQQAELAHYRLGSKDAHSPHAVWVADQNHPPLSPVKGKNVDIHWPLHAVPGTKGFTLIEGLPEVTAYDFFVWKGVEPDMHPYGACYHDLADTKSTGVIEYLLVNKVQTVLVGGLALDYCVKTTALQLAKANFQVIVNLAACRGIAENSINEALNDMHQAGILLIKSAAQVKNSQ
ncbi:nicotinamidase [Spartinivicinus poritis]|uniref:nicotinamidase n=1 Tax=Spartinivicinus poritis TaxID=2994640 RepID=A0ABT5UEN5_9GAMM|nr:nicotinamidase [Spartinivicinus sp. A2-2]MDE1464845.1 nicotinamidase [Spartinivicinus sp. A2-2]